MRLRSDRRGVAALEFAILAPVLVTILLAAIELTYALRLQARLNTTTGQLAELVAGLESVTAPNGTLADSCVGAAFNLLPFKSGTLSANIVSITNDYPANRVVGSTDTKTVSTYQDWEVKNACPTPATASLGLAGAFAAANNSAARSILTKTGVPAASTTDASLEVNYSALVVKTTYVYDNVAPLFLNKFVTLSSSAIARPRGNSQIFCTSVGNTPCPLTQ